MAKKKVQDIEQQVSSELVKTREEVKNLLEVQITAAEPILNMQVTKIANRSYDMFGGGYSHGNKYDKAQQDEFFRQYHVWDDFNKEIFTRSFEHPNNTALDGYERTGISYIISDVVEETKSGIRDKIAYIQGFIQRLHLIPCKAVEKPEVHLQLAVDMKKVFIVHGHNDALKTDVARTIETMGLKAIILHEQEDFGDTIIEKFEKNASDIGFAVVLITGDDMAVSKKDIEKEKTTKGFKALYRPRARQNVVFEMGYFIGKLNRAHVFELLESGVEQPGDLAGVLYTAVDEEGMWKIKLAKRLKAVGYSVNIENII